METIQIKQIIKVFLASSNELSNDRDAFGNLVRRLNNTYEKRGIRLDLFEWEDSDAAYNNRRKQDEYDDQIRNSDMFLALFRTKAGKYTIEEFNVAVEAFRHNGKRPKNYVYIRDLFEGEVETDELVAFKHRLSNEMGYFWIRYNNKDSMQLHFVMQLQLIEGNLIDSLKVENGEVRFEDMTIAQMNNLRFAICNEDYQRMSQRICELSKLIEEARLHVAKHPNEEGFKDELQELLNERNQLQIDLDQQQQFMIDTAIRITRLQGEEITNRMRRAIEAFEEGKAREANIILDEAEHDAEQNLIDYLCSKEHTEQKRKNVIQSIEELLLKASTILVDSSVFIEKRIEQMQNLFDKADHLAFEIDYEKEKHSQLLFDYACILTNVGLYNKAEVIYLRQISIAEGLYGKDDKNTAISYNNIGLVYKKLGDYDKALEYYFKDLAINERILANEHSNIATSYNNIGGVYYSKGNYNKALEYFCKALVIMEKHHETENPNHASSYNNLGLVYYSKGDYNTALEYYCKALAIMEKNNQTKNPNAATFLNNIGGIFDELGHYDTALYYYFNALAIREELLGMKHPDSAQSYNNIGLTYNKKGDYGKALEFLNKALMIHKNYLGTEHPDTAQSYNNIAAVYYNQKDFSMALEYLNKAYQIFKKVFGPEHANTKNLLVGIKFVKSHIEPSIDK